MHTRADHEPAGAGRRLEVTEPNAAIDVADVLRVGRDDVNGFLKKHGGSLFTGAIGTTNVFSGDFDLSGGLVEYGQDFFPSKLARRSYLYLQGLAAGAFSARYFTVRENIPTYLLTQTTAGAGRLAYLGKTYDILPGDVFLLDCRKPHDYRAASPQGWAYRLAHFDGAAMPDMYAQMRSRGTVRFTFGPESRFSGLFQTLFDINRGKAPDREIRSHCVLTELMTELLTALPGGGADEPPDRIQGIREWLAAHCVEKLTLDSIAREFFMSKYHLSREFKRRAGETVFEFVTGARVDAAKQLLRRADDPIWAISERCGFEDQSSFCRCFHRVAGLSPAAYRKQWRSAAPWDYGKP